MCHERADMMIEPEKKKKAREASRGRSVYLRLSKTLGRSEVIGKTNA